MLRLINDFDWSGTSLGPMRDWPATLTVTVRVMLASPAPMVMLMGPDGVMVYNDAYSVFAGQRHPDLLGSKVIEGWPEVADFNRHVMDVGMRGETLTFDRQKLTLWRNETPEEVWLDLDYSPVLGEDGRPLGVLAIVYDTTGRVKAEQALARSEESLSFALDAAGMVGIWDWDIINDCVTSDARFARMFGVDPARAEEGAPIAAFVAGVHPEDRAEVTDRINEALRQCGKFRAEYRLLNREGARERWVLALGRAVPGPEGKAVRLPGVVVDISDRKASEARLAESEAKFRAIADTLPQMVWSTLPDGFHDYYNARWYEYTGVPEGSTDGEGWNGMFHPEDQERAWERWRHSLATGEPYEVEYRLRHHSGEYRWTLGRAVPIRDDHGRITRWFGTCTEIHESKLAAEEREIVAQELSHRIKNIFSVLNGIIGLSARTYPEIRPFAEQLRQRIYAMGQAHEFVRPHSEASRSTVRHSSLLALVAELLEPFRGPGGRRVVLEGPDAHIDDPAATPLALLFYELATNAAKYGALSAEGGEVAITTAMEGDSYRIVWRETGGPKLESPPSKEGFGSRLIALSVSGQMSGKVERFWEPEGLRVDISIPVATLNRSGKIRPTPLPSPATETA